MADPTSPFLDRRTTLKDALSLLLEQDVRAGIVVDRAGSLRGVVTMGQITAWSRERAGAPGPDERVGPHAVPSTGSAVA